MNLIRVDYPRVHGYFVRFERGAKPVRKLFSDGPHGGQRPALRAATALRDRMAPRMPKPQRHRTPPSPGRVYRGVASWRDAAGELHAYACFYVWIKIAPGRRRYTKFSADRHGSREARAMAAAKLRGWQVEQARNYG